MAYDFNGKTVVVTGASKGIGRELSIAMVERGATVIGVARSTEILEEIKKYTQSFSGSFLPYSADLAPERDDEMNNVMNEVVDKIFRHGGAHVLVLNAGMLEKNYFPATKMTGRMNRLNIVSPTTLLQVYMGRYVEESPNNPLEMVVTILSENAIKLYPGSAVYSGTKSGLLTTILSVEEEIAEERGNDETEYGRRYKPPFRDTEFRYVYFSSVETGIWDRSKENTYGPTDISVKIPLAITIKHGLMGIDGTYEPRHIGVLTDYNRTEKGYPLIVEGYKVVRKGTPTVKEAPKVDFENPIMREVVGYF